MLLSRLSFRRAQPTCVRARGSAVSSAGASPESHSRWSSPEVPNQRALDEIDGSEGPVEQHLATNTVESNSSGADARFVFARDGSGSGGHEVAATRVVVLKRDARSNFGLRVSADEGPEDRYPLITNAAEGAREVGLRNGDVVLEVDGVTTLGRPLRNVYTQLMQGRGDIRLVLRARETETTHAPLEPLTREIRVSDAHNTPSAPKTVSRSSVTCVCWRRCAELSRRRC
jgi:hypothetical protein